MTSPRVHRNAPCPCGSGKKFKHCHGRSGATLTRRVSLPLWAFVGMIVVIVGATGMLFSAVSRNPLSNSRTLPAPGFGTTLPDGARGPEPAPYAYDPAANRYWDPAHRHWHDGRPPDSAQRVAGAPTATMSTVPTTATPTPARSDTGRR